MWPCDIEEAGACAESNLRVGENRLLPYAPHTSNNLLSKSPCKLFLVFVKTLLTSISISLSNILPREYSYDIWNISFLLWPIFLFQTLPCPCHSRFMLHQYNMSTMCMHVFSSALSNFRLATNTFKIIFLNMTVLWLSLLSYSLCSVVLCVLFVPFLTFQPSHPAFKLNLS